MSGSIGGTAGWLLFMGALAVIIAFAGFNSGFGGTAVLSIIGIIELILLVVGTVVGLLSVGIIIVFVVIGLAVIAMVIRNAVVGGG